MIYFDHNATTPVHPEVAQAMSPYWNAGTELYGNPSSIHSFGQKTRKAVEEARDQAALLLGADPDEIIFTSCGSESDTTAIKGAAYAAAERGKGKHIIISSIEHDTVRFCCEYLEKQGWQVNVLPVAPNGILDPETLKGALRPDTVLVSVMHANNELGTLQPIAELSSICREKGVLLHTDAIQTVGKIPTNVQELGVDLLSLSAHKFYGPKGVGALYIRKGTRMHPLFHGHHEKNRRAGTENVAGIVGLGAACAVAKRDLIHDQKQVRQLRDQLENGIINKVPLCRVNGDLERRVPGCTNISFEYIEGEGCIVMMDIEGIAASTGSACASGTTLASHVLRAIGLTGNAAQGTVRFSLGRTNTQADVDNALEIIPSIIHRLRSLSPVWTDKMQGQETQVTPPARFLPPKG